jgi:DICT domain-containing protein
MAAMDAPEDLLTTAQLAARTGVRTGTLRMWETRHGFPAPQRLPGGHHRYTAGDVALVRAVLRRRGEGLSLGAAIARSAVDAAPTSSSIFSALRTDHPDLRPRRVSKRALLALTRAIEDEHMARSEGGIAIGSFQAERRYRASQTRWCELARGAAVAVALADFARLKDPRGQPVEVPVDEGSSLRREWTLIVASARAGACLAAWELPDTPETSEPERRFEAIWSFAPASVHTALRAARTVLAASAPAVGDRLAAEMTRSIRGDLDLRFATDLAGRAFGYLAAEIGPA